MRSTFLCLAAIAQLVISSVSSAEPTPLERRTNNNDNKLLLQEAEILDNGMYATTISIGSPPQNFTVVLDTASGYSWVRGYRCKTENCLGRKSYSTISSKSSEPTGKKFSVKYGASCVDTNIILDDVRYSSLHTKGQAFGSAYRMTGFEYGFDGHFGLGPDVDLFERKLTLAPAANWNKRDLSNTAFVPNAYQQGQVYNPAFSTFTADSNSGFDQNGGSTTLPPNNGGTTTGGNNGTTTTPPANNNGTTTTPPTTNPGTNTGTTTGGNGQVTSGGNGQVSSGGFGFSKRSNTGSSKPKAYFAIGGVVPGVVENDAITYLPISEPKQGKSRNYDICIKRAKIGKQLILPQADDATAAISTSSPYIVMPQSQADEFKKVYGGKFYRKSGTYSVKCSEIKDLPPLKITLDNKIIQIPATYWTREKDADRDCCEVLIAKGASDTNWILGSPFSKPFYTIFDPLNNRIGFGIKKGNKDTELKIYDA